MGVEVEIFLVDGAVGARLVDIAVRRRVIKGKAPVIVGVRVAIERGADFFGKDVGIAVIGVGFLKEPPGREPFFIPGELLGLCNRELGIPGRIVEEGREVVEAGIA